MKPRFSLQEQLYERGIDHAFCGGYVAKLLQVGSERVTNVTPSPTSSKAENMLIYVQEIDPMTSEDPTEAFKLMPEFTRVSWRRWHYRYCGTTVFNCRSILQKWSLPRLTIFARRSIGIIEHKVSNIIHTGLQSAVN